MSYKFSINQNYQESVSSFFKQSNVKGLALIKITKSPYLLLSSDLTFTGLALIKITKSPYRTGKRISDTNSLALIKITKSPYLMHVLTII